MDKTRDIYEGAKHIRALEEQIEAKADELKQLRRAREEAISALLDVALDTQGELPLGEPAPPLARKCIQCGKTAKKWANDELCLACYVKED